MLNRWRLPHDDFPDDTETRAFQEYGQSTRSFRRWWVLAGSGVLVSILITVAVYLLWPEAEPSRSLEQLSPETPPPDPLQILAGDFPTEVIDRNRISIPARIDDFIAAGGKRAYVFYASSSANWNVEILADGDFTISIYGPPNGIFIGSYINSVVAYFEKNQLYAILIESPSGGGYTIRILLAD